MDKLIEQAIKNCKINKYEKYFEEVCKEHKRLLDAENRQLRLHFVTAMLPSDDFIENNGKEGGLRDGELQMFWEGAKWLKSHLQKRLSEGRC